MTQYVEQFPLPSEETKETKEIVELVQSSLERNSELRLREKERLDDLV